MSKLTKLFEYQSEGKVGRKRLANTESFKTQVLDTLPKDQKELIISDAADSSALLQTEVYNTIVEGQMEAVCVREHFPIIQTDTNQIRVTYMSGSTGYAMDVAEGAAIPLDDSYFYTKNIDIKKIGTRPLVTNEMVEDGLWDLVQWELGQAGRRIENKFNRNVINVMVNNCGTVQPDSTPSINTIAYCRKEIMKKHWNPTKGLMIPLTEGTIVSGNQWMQYQLAGDTDAFRKGTVGTVMGIDFYRLGIDGDSAEGDQVWNGGYDAAEEVCMLIYDPAVFSFIGMRRDLEVEKYKDPIHDLVGLSATMRFGSKVIHESAGAIVDHA